MKMTVTFAGLVLFLAAFLFSPGLMGNEGKPIAFWNVTKEKNGNCMLTLKVAKNGYLYASQLQIAIHSGKKKLLPITPLFKPKKIVDPVSGEKADVLEGTSPFRWRFTPGKADYPISGKITFQGCWKGGNGKEAMCLFPEDISFTISKAAFRNMVLYPKKKMK